MHKTSLPRMQAALIAMAMTLLWCVAPAVGQLRVVNYNVAQLNGNHAALQSVFAALHDDDRPGFAVPVGVFIFQEVQSTDVAVLLNLLNASAPPGVTYALATYTNEDKDGSAGAQAMFYRTDMLSEVPAAHEDLYTGAGRFADRWLLTLNGYDPQVARLYVYSSHLKSDTGSANQQERLQGVISIRQDADALGVGLHIIYAGDQNFYNNLEPGYLHYLSPGNGQAVDPLGSDSWAYSVDPNNAIKHTQSPRVNSASGLVGGGLDDRFDFQFLSNALADGQGLSIIWDAPFSYRAVGNDNQHYDSDINSGNNTYFPNDIPRSNALADALHIASDHLPVAVDYQLPAVLAGSIASSLGRVIHNTPYEAVITVSNAADVVTPLGADVLAYNAVGSFGLSGAHSGMLEALQPAAEHSFAFDTSTVGIRLGRVTLTSSSEAVANPVIQLNTSGTIVRPSNPSFSDSSDIDQLVINETYEAGSGAHAIAVEIHNLGHDSLQALLDIDSVEGLASPFSFIGGLTSGIDAEPAMLHFAFDATDLSPGVYNATATVNTSDEDIPGETTTVLTIEFSIAIDSPQTCAADITGDGLVNVNDLLAVINAWGTCPQGQPANCPADVNEDQVVSVEDLLAVITGWGTCL